MDKEQHEEKEEGTLINKNVETNNSPMIMTMTSNKLN
jgi:hypothetical protein